jgi:hypothetical protein
MISNRVCNFITAVWVLTLFSSFWWWQPSPRPTPIASIDAVIELPAYRPAHSGGPAAWASKK